MKEYDVEIEGTTPMLMNRFMEASIDSETKKRAGAAEKHDIENKLYKDAKGKAYVPAVYLFNSIVEAGKNFKVRGKGKATYSKLIGSTVEVGPDEIVHVKQAWKPYIISAVNPMTKGRMMVSRPMFGEWSLKFTVAFEEKDIPAEVMKEVLDYAGQYVGIGDWRPQKKGKYGKFMVTKFKEVEA